MTVPGVRAEQGLHGIWASVLLPLDDEERIDAPLLRGQITHLASSDVHGVYAHGTAGEFHLLTEAEFDLVAETLAAVCRAVSTPFQIGASHPVPQVTLERVARTRDLRPAAYQIVFPEWLPLSDPECERFLRRVAAVAAPVPLVLYNPPHAKTRPRPALLQRLLDAVPSLVGLKVADGDERWYAAMHPVLERCSVFVPGHHLATGLAHGAQGSYSNVAALSPHGAVRWYDLATSNATAAADLERRVLQFFAEHVDPLRQRGCSDPALDKFLAEVGGCAPAGLRVRWPYTSVPSEAVRPARATALDLLPELMSPR